RPPERVRSAPDPAWHSDRVHGWGGGAGGVDFRSAGHRLIPVLRRRAARHLRGAGRRPDDRRDRRHRELHSGRDPALARSSDPRGADWRQVSEMVVQVESPPVVAAPVRERSAQPRITRLEFVVGVLLILLVGSALIGPILAPASIYESNILN